MHVTADPTKIYFSASEDNPSLNQQVKLAKIIIFQKIHVTQSALQTLNAKLKNIK